MRISNISNTSFKGYIRLYTSSPLETNTLPGDEKTLKALSGELGNPYSKTIRNQGKKEYSFFDEDGIMLNTDNIKDIGYAGINYYIPKLNKTVFLAPCHDEFIYGNNYQNVISAYAAAKNSDVTVDALTFKD